MCVPDDPCEDWRFEACSMRSECEKFCCDCVKICEMARELRKDLEEEEER